MTEAKAIQFDDNGEWIRMPVKMSDGSTVIVAEGYVRHLIEGARKHQAICPLYQET
jgi:hypothetical protein